MKRQLLILFALLALLVWTPSDSARADGFGHGKGHGIRHTGSRAVGGGFGLGGFGCGYGWDLAELYRELLNNVPYYALHPPVYYSYPVPRTYGYSPFAYPGYVMTPEVACEPQPLEIINPHVPSHPEGAGQKPASLEKDRAAGAGPAVGARPEPLVILNPFVAPQRAVAQSER
jgi:hypothetical protein